MVIQPHDLAGFFGFLHQSDLICRQRREAQTTENHSPNALRKQSDEKGEMQTQKRHKKMQKKKDLRRLRLTATWNI